MIPAKCLLIIALFIIASLQYVSPYACPQIPNCQTLEMCFAFDDDPSNMVWGPCEDCPEGTGTCLEYVQSISLRRRLTELLFFSYLQQEIIRCVRY